MGLSTTHLIIFLVIIVLVFGTKKLKNIGSDLGSAVKGFKDGVKDGDKPAAEAAAQPTPTATAQVAEKRVDNSQAIDVEARLDAIDRALDSIDGPVIIVAHSAGCMMVAHWALRRARPILGALLAAPADVETQMPAGYPSKDVLAAHGWTPIPRQRLPFPTLLAASSNDPLTQLERARSFARDWGSELVELGPQGHLNPASGHGPWPQAKQLIEDLQQRFAAAELIGADGQYEQTVAQVVALIEQPRLGLTLPLDIQGTAFQQRVWQALAGIPYGQTRSYGEQAASIGKPTAVRAVGAANGRNPLPIILPCHRVIGRDGSLTGYAGGLARKAWLLEHEQKTNKIK